MTTKSEVWYPWEQIGTAPDGQYLIRNKYFTGLARVRFGNVYLPEEFEKDQPIWFLPVPRISRETPLASKSKFVMPPINLQL